MERLSLYTGFDDEEVARLRSTFDASRVVTLPLLSGAAAAYAREALDGVSWFRRAHGEIARELNPDSGTAVACLMHLANSPDMRSLVERITSCGPIASFVGRVYRMTSDEDLDTWHDDNEDGLRLVGMSINLSERPFQGGEFEIRDESTMEVLARHANTTFGDALLFAIGAGLRHRVRQVRGPMPKTSFAGWFCSAPSYAELLRGTRPPSVAR